MVDQSILAAAAAAIETCGFDCSDEKQWWVDLLASAFGGLILLPFALLFVLGIHGLKLNRWRSVTAVSATVFALVASEGTHQFVAPIFTYSEHMFEMAGLGRFRYLLIPGIFVCFGGALSLAWWCKRRGLTEAFK